MEISVKYSNNPDAWGEFWRIATAPGTKLDNFLSGEGQVAKKRVTVKNLTAVGSWSWLDVK